MSPGTIGWRDIALSWLASRSPHNADTIEALFEKYVPAVIEFLCPVLAGSIPAKSADSVSSVSLSEKACRSQWVEPQDLMLSEVHLVKQCCQILEVRMLCI